MASPDPLELAVELEGRVWQALVDGDPAADTALLADDFLGVYPTGFADRADHAGQLDAGPTVATYSIVEPVVRVIGADDLLLSYEARYRRPSQRDEERMFVTSLWSRRGGRWLNVFSQDTPAGDGDPPP